MAKAITAVEVPTQPLTLEHLKDVLLKLIRAKARRNTPPLPIGPQAYPPPPPLPLTIEHLPQLLLRLMEPIAESDSESDSEDPQSETDEASKFGEEEQSSGVQPSGQTNSEPQTSFVF